MTRANVLLYFGANFMPRLAMFLLLLLLTRLLPMDDYGLFTLVVTTGEILDTAFGGWVRIFILSSESRPRRPSARRLGRILLLAGGSCILSLLIGLLIPIMQPNLSGHFVIAVSMYVLAFASLRLGLTLLQTQQRHHLYAGIEMMRGLLALGGGIVAVYAIEPTFLAASLGISFTTLGLAVIACATAMQHLPKPGLPAIGYRAPILFGIPLVTVALASQVVGWLDRFILNAALGPTSVALYAAAYALARQPVDLFSGSLNPYIFPMLVRSYSTEGRGAAGRIQSGNFIALVMLCGAVTVGIALLAKPFATLLLPDAYRTVAAQVMPWIAFATLCNGLKNFCFDNVFYIANRNWYQFATIAPAAVLSLVSGLLLIPLGGPVAAAMIAAASAILSLAISVWLSTRVLPFAVPRAAVFGLGVSLMLAFLAALCTDDLLRLQPPLVSLVTATLAFVVVYAAALTALGFSLIRLLDRPWDIWQGRSKKRYGAAGAKTLLNSSR
jgi:O-antigen/teichoic acid export membrane protein